MYVRTASLTKGSNIEQIIIRTAITYKSKCHINSTKCGSEQIKLDENDRSITTKGAISAAILNTKEVISIIVIIMLTNLNSK